MGFGAFEKDFHSFCKCSRWASRQRLARGERWPSRCVCEKCREWEEILANSCSKLIKLKCSAEVSGWGQCAQKQSEANADVRDRKAAQRPDKASNCLTLSSIDSLTLPVNDETRSLKCIFMFRCCNWRATGFRYLKLWKLVAFKASSWVAFCVLCMSRDRKKLFSWCGQHLRERAHG